MFQEMTNASALSENKTTFMNNEHIIEMYD